MRHQPGAPRDERQAAGVLTGLHGIGFYDNKNGWWRWLRFSSGPPTAAELAALPG